MTLKTDPNLHLNVVEPIAFACLPAAFDRRFWEGTPKATGITYNCIIYSFSLFQATFIVVDNKGLDVGSRLPCVVCISKPSPFDQIEGFPSLIFFSIKPLDSKDVILLIWKTITIWKVYLWNLGKLLCLCPSQTTNCFFWKFCRKMTRGLLSLFLDTHLFCYHIIVIMQRLR